MHPSSSTTPAPPPAGGAGEAAAAQQCRCRGCSAPLARAALGLSGIMMFGTAETRDLCARCTLEYNYRTGGLGAAGRSSSSTAGHAAATCPFAFAAAATASARPPPRPNPNRCAACRKKAGLLGFACRCGRTFCAAHRHADSHGCSFDCRKAKGFAFAREAGANP